MSLVEAIANVAIGYGIAVSIQVFAFPLFGLYVAFTDNLLIGGIFTLASIARSFAVRRTFEAIRTPKKRKPESFGRADHLNGRRKWMLQSES